MKKVEFFFNKNWPCVLHFLSFFSLNFFNLLQLSDHGYYVSFVKITEVKMAWTVNIWAPFSEG